MSEYWKSTPKYWCKHCSTYVRDTKLERTNHEATAKHQSALKRFLRDLHRSHENEEREKDRAKREIDRLNGVVRPPGPPSAASSSKSSGATAGSASLSQRQQQWEQLASMGIDVPTELRGDMAMAGEWTVTKTRIIKDVPETEEDQKDPKLTDPDASARKRPRTDDADGDEGEEEKAHDLFKKPKRWGRDSKHAVDDDAELDALLNAPLIKQQSKEEDEKKPDIKQDSPGPKVKTEEPDSAQDVLSGITEPVADEKGIAPTIKEDPDKEPAEPVVVFKKRKPKNVRQK